MLKDVYPLYLNNTAVQPNTDLAVTDKFTGEVAFRTALATPDATLTAAELLQDPESQLRQVFAALEAGQRPLALHQAQQLAEQWPHFQLAQLVYADLLNLELPRPVNALDHPDGLALGKRAQELASEAWQRLRHPPLEACADGCPKVFTC